MYGKNEDLLIRFFLTIPAYQDSGILTIYGGTGVNQLDSLYETISQTLNNFKRDGVTEKELYNSKEQLKGSLNVKS